MKKIMVVDDDIDLLTNLKVFIKKKGYEPAVTTSCEQGLQILNSFKPDIIFLDINVGNEDGRIMCKKIKKLADYRHIPVILMSANHDLLRFYKDCEADAFLNKPFELSGLMGALTLYL